MENILFIIKSHSRNDELANENYLSPLGVLSLCTVLELNGYHVEIIDQSLEYVTGKNVVDKIRALSPVFVGVSAYTETIDECLRLCKYIKKNCEDTKIVLGGPHPSVDSEYCKKSKYIDFIALGEGEALILELAEAIRTDERLISYVDIPGLIYRNKKDNSFSEIERHNYIDDLDLLPITKRQFLDVFSNAVYITISSSRGCPGLCVYCAASMMSGSHYRVRNIESVFLETVLMLKTVSREKEIYYIDDTFTALINRVKRYLALIEESGLNFRWRCESRVDIMSRNKEIVLQMKEHGCRRIQYGIESGNQEVLNKIHKNMDLREAKELIDYSVSAGLKVATSFIYGHYCDTEKTMNDTYDFMYQLRNKYCSKVEIYFSFNTPLPGTYQYIHKDELGLKMTVNNFADLDLLHPVAITENFDLEMLERFRIKSVMLMN